MDSTTLTVSLTTAPRPSTYVAYTHGEDPLDVTWVALQKMIM